MHEQLTYAGRAVVSYLRAIGQTSIPLLVLQLLGLGALLVGISFWSIPAALVVGGILAIAAAEMQSSGLSKESADELENARNQEIRKHVDETLKAGKNPFKVGGVPMTPMWVQYVDAVTRTVPGPKTDR
jgi:hypothetical protein